MENNQSLYRFTSFEALVDIIQREALTLVLPSLWNDPYEGYIFSISKTKEGQELIYNELLKIVDKNVADGHTALLFNLDKAFFAQCWTKKDESDALWRIYSHGNSAVRLGVKVDKVKKIKYPTSVNIGEVTYHNSISIEDELSKIIAGNTMHAWKTLLSKRDAFNHEEEVRIIVSDSYNLGKKEVTQEELGLIKQKYSSLVNNGLPQVVADGFISNYLPVRKKLYLPIGNPSDFIESVMLHPLASSWLDETLAEFCKRNNIKYLGKSKLYELELR